MKSSYSKSNQPESTKERLFPETGKKSLEQNQYHKYSDQKRNSFNKNQNQNQSGSISGKAQKQIQNKPGQKFLNSPDHLPNLKNRSFTQNLPHYLPTGSNNIYNKNINDISQNKTVNQQPQQFQSNLYNADNFITKSSHQKNSLSQSQSAQQQNNFFGEKQQVSREKQKRQHSQNREKSFNSHLSKVEIPQNLQLNNNNNDQNDKNFINNNNQNDNVFLHQEIQKMEKNFKEELKKEREFLQAQLNVMMENGNFYKNQQLQKSYLQQNDLNIDPQQKDNDQIIQQMRKDILNLQTNVNEKIIGSQNSIDNQKLIQQLLEKQNVFDKELVRLSQKNEALENQVIDNKQSIQKQVSELEYNLNDFKFLNNNNINQNDDLLGNYQPITLQKKQSAGSNQINDLQNLINEIQKNQKKMQTNVQNLAENIGFDLKNNNSINKTNYQQTIFRIEDLESQIKNQQKDQNMKIDNLKVLITDIERIQNQKLENQQQQIAGKLSLNNQDTDKQFQQIQVNQENQSAKNVMNEDIQIKNSQKDNSDIQKDMENLNIPQNKVTEQIQNMIALEIKTRLSTEIDIKDVTQKIASDIIQQINEVKEVLDKINKQKSEEIQEIATTCQHRSQQLSIYTEQESKKVYDALNLKVGKMKTIIQKLAEQFKQYLQQPQDGNKIDPVQMEQVNEKLDIMQKDIDNTREQVTIQTEELIQRNKAFQEKTKEGFDSVLEVAKELQNKLESLDQIQTQPYYLQQEYLERTYTPQNNLNQYDQDNQQLFETENQQNNGEKQIYLKNNSKIQNLSKPPRQNLTKGHQKKPQQKIQDQFGGQILDYENQKKGIDDSTYIQYAQLKGLREPNELLNTTDQFIEKDAEVCGFSRKEIQKIKKFIILHGSRMNQNESDLKKVIDYLKEVEKVNDDNLSLTNLQILELQKVLENQQQENLKQNEEIKEIQEKQKKFEKEVESQNKNGKNFYYLNQEISQNKSFLGDQVQTNSRSELFCKNRIESQKQLLNEKDDVEKTIKENRQDKDMQEILNECLHGDEQDCGYSKLDYRRIKKILAVMKLKQKRMIREFFKELDEVRNHIVNADDVSEHNQEVLQKQLNVLKNEIEDLKEKTSDMVVDVEGGSEQKLSSKTITPLEKKIQTIDELINSVRDESKLQQQSMFSKEACDLDSTTDIQNNNSGVNISNNQEQIQKIKKHLKMNIGKTDMLNLIVEKISDYLSDNERVKVLNQNQMELKLKDFELDIQGLKKNGSLFQSQNTIDHVSNRDISSSEQSSQQRDLSKIKKYIKIHSEKLNNADAKFEAIQEYVDNTTKVNNENMEVLEKDISQLKKKVNNLSQM